MYTRSSGTGGYYGGLHRKSWTSEDCQRKTSRNFGLWHDYLRLTMGVSQRAIALAWVCECAFGNSIGFCHQLTVSRSRRPELLVQTSVENGKIADSRRYQQVRVIYGGTCACHPFLFPSLPLLSRRIRRILLLPPAHALFFSAFEIHDSRSSTLRRRSFLRACTWTAVHAI